ncbi:hypothetical protein H9P43_004490 [Blastocladiella emersonii ATCC 22665]|nr:hypothetical protein H9P43_004490 [Blastocladiella emersonii ATCC 22665]
MNHRATHSNGDAASKPARRRRDSRSRTTTGTNSPLVAPSSQSLQRLLGLLSDFPLSPTKGDSPSSTTTGRPATATRSTAAAGAGAPSSVIQPDAAVSWAALCHNAGIAEQGWLDAPISPVKRVRSPAAVKTPKKTVAARAAATKSPVPGLSLDDPTAFPGLGGGGSQQEVKPVVVESSSVPLWPALPLVPPLPRPESDDDDDDESPIPLEYKLTSATLSPTKQTRPAAAAVHLPGQSPRAAPARPATPPPTQVTADPAPEPAIVIPAPPKFVSGAHAVALLEATLAGDGDESQGDSMLEIFVTDSSNATTRLYMDAYDVRAAALAALLQSAMVVRPAGHGEPPAPTVVSTAAEDDELSSGPGKSPAEHALAAAAFAPSYPPRPLVSADAVIQLAASLRSSSDAPSTAEHDSELFGPAAPWSAFPGLAADGEDGDSVLEACRAAAATAHAASPRLGDQPAVDNAPDAPPTIDDNDSLLPPPLGALSTARFDPWSKAAIPLHLNDVLTRYRRRELRPPRPAAAAPLPPPHSHADTPPVRVDRELDGPEASAALESLLGSPWTDSQRIWVRCRPPAHVCAQLGVATAADGDGSVLLALTPEDLGTAAMGAMIGDVVAELPGSGATAVAGEEEEGRELAAPQPFPSTAPPNP